MGYIRGVIHGMVIGTAIGVAIAPQEGAKTREQARLAIERMRTGIDSAQEAARRVAPQVRGAAGTAASVVDSLRERVGHRAEGSNGIEISGSPSGTARTPVDAPL
jgi:gas vesicle protein